MGRTIPSFRIALEQEVSSWREYRKALGAGARDSLDRVFSEARNYCSASSNAARPVRFEGLFMAVAFAHAKRLEEITRAIEAMELELSQHGKN